MKIWSNSFKNNETINKKYIADGDNVSIHVAWDELPKETKSLAMYVHDSDAPMPSGFWHWMVINIPTTAKELKEGISGNIDFALEMNHDGEGHGYYGPQPPKGHGVHNYVVTVVALDIDKLDKTPTSSKPYAAFEIWNHKIDSAQLSFKYEEK